MPPINASHHTQTLVTHAHRDFAKLAIKLPAGCLHVLELRDALLDHIADDPAVDLRTGIIDGTFTAKTIVAAVDKAATEQLAHERAQQLLGETDRPMIQAFATALRGDADRIIDDLRGPFDEAAAALTATVDILGDNPDNHKHIGRSTAGALALNRRDIAIAQLNVVRKIRVVLAACGYGDLNEDRAWWVADAHSLDAVTRPVRWWDIAVDPDVGAFRLNTPDEAARVRAGAAAIDGNKAAAEAAARVEAGEGQLRRAEQEIEAWARLAPVEPR